MKSFGYAVKGVIYTIKTQRHMRIHLCVGFYVILAGLVTKLSTAQWAAVLICIALVTASECMNTALESACDAVSRQPHPLIGTAKDAAAGAVLICAVISAVVGGLIFFRAERIALARDFMLENPAASVVIVLLLIPWMIFIFRKRKTNDK